MVAVASYWCGSSGDVAVAESFGGISCAERLGVGVTWSLGLIVPAPEGTSLIRATLLVLSVS